MLTVVRCLYWPGGAEDRLPIRDEHIKYMIANRQWLEQGGALMSSDGIIVEGMFLILRHENRKDVEGFLANAQIIIEQGETDGADRRDQNASDEVAHLH